MTAARVRSPLAPIALLLWPFACHAAAPAQQVCDTTRYPLSTPTVQFEDHGDGTVTDRRSNLMWLRCAAGQEWTGATCVGTPTTVSWGEAQDAAKAINAGGKHFFSDWRLPQIQELAMIAERQCRNPRINLTLFPATPEAAFWSSTSRPSADAEASAFTLSFGQEGIAYENKEARHYVRLVRNGP
jgi:hypothetical protein